MHAAREVLNQNYQVIVVYYLERNSYTFKGHGLRLTKQLATKFLRSYPLFQLDTIVANHGFESTSFVRIVHTLVTDE